MSVRKPLNRPRDGGISWATASAGDTYRKNPTRNICQVKDMKLCFHRKKPIVSGFLRLETNLTNTHRS